MIYAILGLYLTTMRVHIGWIKDQSLGLSKIPNPQIVPKEVCKVWANDNPHAQVIIPKIVFRYAGVIASNENQCCFQNLQQYDFLNSLSLNFCHRNE